MKVYIVTDGVYSAYAIHGAFSTMEKAERFRHHRDFDTTETMEVDEEVPQSDMVAYRYVKYFEKDVDILSRRDTENFVKTDWSACGYNDQPPIGASCDFLARDEQHAAKIARERLSALMSGSVLLKVVHQVPVAPMLDGRPSATHTMVSREDYYSLVTGSPVLVQKEI